MYEIRVVIYVFWRGVIDDLDFLLLIYEFKDFYDLISLKGFMILVIEKL